jgi:hypothetical protein
LPIPVRVLAVDDETLPPTLAGCPADDWTFVPNDYPIVTVNATETLSVHDNSLAIRLSSHVAI